MRGAGGHEVGGPLCGLDPAVVWMDVPVKAPAIASAAPHVFLADIVPPTVPFVRLCRVANHGLIGPVVARTSADTFYDYGHFLVTILCVGIATAPTTGGLGLRCLSQHKSLLVHVNILLRGYHV